MALFFRSLKASSEQRYGCRVVSPPAGIGPFHRLEFDAAVRYDHYDTYGGQATPKFGLKYTPIDMFTIRGTWGKGFRAPSTAEAGVAGLAFGQGNVGDPVLCPNGVANQKGTFNALCSYPGVGVSSSNPNLKAVTSKNATFGVIFEPAKIFSASIDYYWIQLTNDIISASAAGGLGAPFLTLIRGAPAVRSRSARTQPPTGLPATPSTWRPMSTACPSGIPRTKTFPM